MACQILLWGGTHQRQKTLYRVEKSNDDIFRRTQTFNQSLFVQ